VYTDSFIANHLKEITGGKTHAELSSQLQTDKNNTHLAQTVQTMFQGETLRGLLLSSYAFWTLGSIAGWGALAAFIDAGLLLILAVFGFIHSRRIDPKEERLAQRPRVSQQVRLNEALGTSAGSAAGGPDHGDEAQSSL
jgi:hypothetical protein